MIAEMNKKKKGKVLNKWKFKTILYPWNDDDEENPANFNLLISEYYPVVVDRRFCRVMKELPFHYGNYYNYSCINDLKQLTKPQPFFKYAISSQMNTADSEGEKYLVPTLGNKTRDKVQLISVCSPCLLSYVGKIMVDGYIPQRRDCDEKFKQFTHNPSQLAYHDEVFILSQQWGFSYFHKMVENFPKIALYLEFLKKNHHIKILFVNSHSRNKELLEVLGIDGNRQLSGNVAARIAYVPRNTHCGSASIIDVQMLNRAYNEYIVNILNRGKPLVRNKIILIKRSKIRRILEHSDIIKELEIIAKKHNLVLEVFNDEPLQSLSLTMLLFAQAVAVVGPHGAGFANLVFSAQGTIVIEGLLKSDLIICFQRLAYALGMRYYGMTSQIDDLAAISLEAKQAAHQLDNILNNIGL